MLQLLIDTASEKAFIGLSSDGGIIEFARLPTGLQNSRFLFPQLLDLLNKQGLTPKDLGLIGCGIGPGSYTGIRVGAAIAQSMAYALRIPLVGMCSLRSYIPKNPGTFVSMFDARVGGVYLLKGEFNGKEVKFEEEPQVVTLENVNDAIRGIDVCVTPHKAQLIEKISADFVEWEEGEPSGEFFAMQVDADYRNNLFSTKAELKLLYLRKTQAEIEKTWV